MLTKVGVVLTSAAVFRVAVGRERAAFFDIPEIREPSSLSSLSVSAVAALAANGPPSTDSVSFSSRFLGIS